MFTFLVCLGVIAATIAVVLRVALSGPDQPATIRREPSRARPSRKDEAGKAAEPSRKRRAVDTRPTSTAPIGTPVRAAPGRTLPGAPVLALSDSDTMRLRVLPAAPTTIWVRIRSGVALVVLVAVLGALLALAVAGLLLGAAFLVRSATA